MEDLFQFVRDRREKPGNPHIVILIDPASKNIFIGQDPATQPEDERIIEAEYIDLDE